MKKAGRNLIIALIAVIVIGIYYYVSLPAINIHSAGCWMFVISAMVILAILAAFKAIFGKNSRITKTDYRGRSVPDVKGILKSNQIAKILVIFAGVLIIVYFIGSILSSPIINAKRYQKLLTIENREFTEDVKEVNFDTIPLLDKASAEILGNRKMGSMVDMVSQFEVAGDYTQINYKGSPVRVTPLVYANAIKWLTNQSKGIPAYIMIDMATQDTECVKLSEGIKYSKSEYFNRNIYRHLRFHYPTYIWGDQIFFEIDDEGVPYWVCPVKKFNIGLFGGQTVGRVVLCNAITGECTDYDINEVPQWIDKVYQAELLMQLYDYAGTLQHGYFNSVLGQKDCLQSTNGYNYIALDDDVWVYTGVTSVSGDQSNVGFVLMNQRTMETRYYKIEGAIEDSAMASAEGQVQNLGYNATFPLLLNIGQEPTYFMALKDAGGLVKKYAMVNVEKYQYVAIGDTIEECKTNYTQLLKTSGITVAAPVESQDISGSITVIEPVVLDGTTHFYLCVSGSEDVFDVDMSNADFVSIIKAKEGDKIELSYEKGNGINRVTAIK